MEIDAYVEALASALPTPGGGSAAALTGAFGAALVAMVARITLGNATYASVHGLASDLVTEADSLRHSLLTAQRADERAYGGVVAAGDLPKGTPEEKAARTARMQAALLEAARVPLATGHRLLETLVLVRRALDLGNEHLVSDLGCAAEFASAALRACAYNVRINHRYLRDAETVALQASELQRIEADAERELALVREGARLVS